MRLAVAGLALAVIVACQKTTVEPTVEKSSPTLRAERRLFDGAPPVIPHDNLGAACASCHNDRGIEVAGLGFAPPSPHARTAGVGDRARCRQCHVFKTTDGRFRKNTFVGLKQNLRRGERLYASAPPVIPHDVFMRENCSACHAGEAARESIRTPHPERTRCQQCHVPTNREATSFARPSAIR